jgi:hypothetical protein
VASLPYLHSTVSRCVEFVFLSSVFFFFGGGALMHVYAVFTTSTVNAPGCGANKKEGKQYCNPHTSHSHTTEASVEVS